MARSNPKTRRSTVMASMGSLGGGGGSGASAQSIPQIMQQPPQIANTVQQANQQNNANFSAVDNSPFHQLVGGRQYYLNQSLDIDSQIAIANYLSPTPENGTLYSMSQNMNYAMARGLKLTANQRYVRDGLMDAMHNLGQNVYLYRYDHDGMMNSLVNMAGLKGSYENYSTQQLKNALVGATFKEDKFLSTSYNDFRHAINPQVFTSRAVKIVYEAKAGTQAQMTGNGAGGALGEIVLAPSQQMRIKDVRYTGNTARRQGTQSYTQKQIEIVVEVG